MTISLAASWADDAFSNLLNGFGGGVEVSVFKIVDYSDIDQVSVLKIVDYRVIDLSLRYPFISDHSSN